MEHKILLHHVKIYVYFDIFKYHKILLHHAKIYVYFDIFKYQNLFPTEPDHNYVTF